MNRNMLKVFFACVMVLYSTVGLIANETVDVWSQMYREAASDSQRRMVMIKIMELKNKDFAPLLQTALDDLYNRRIEAGTTTERSAKIDLCRMLVRELGNLKASDASLRIYAIYNEINDPLLRYECAIALGNLRANDYAFKLIRDLADLNLAPDLKNPRPKEIQAFGLVQGLDSLRSPLSYEVLFLASTGWYSNNSKVKDLARAALTKITDDPSENLGPIILHNESIKIKLEALDAESNSKASSTNKAAVARVALRAGLDFAAKNSNENADLSRLRKQALSLLTSTSDHDKASVPLLAEIIARDANNDATYDETLQSLAVAGYNASDEAAKLLNDRLEYYNERQRNEVISPRDKILVREVIAAMKRAKNPLNKTVLFKTANLEIYDSAILREARDALTVMGN